MNDEANWRFCFQSLLTLNIIENFYIDLKRTRWSRNLTELEDFYKEELVKIPQTETEWEPWLA